jgi:hypothetical protein
MAAIEQAFRDGAARLPQPVDKSVDLALSGLAERPSQPG